MNPATQQVKRAVRLMAMRDMLSTKPATIAELQQRFGVSRSTIYLDLQDLQLAPIEFPLCCVQLWAAEVVIRQLSEQTGR
jgi:predicted DNA-binding transcriptional regulator YafY